MATPAEPTRDRSPLLDRPLGDALERLAAGDVDSPAGSSAALCGALAAALAAAMAGNMDADVAEGAVVQADALRARLCDLAESTGAAHRWARSLLDLAAADPAQGEESDARNRQLQAALDEAAEVPLEICETAADVVAFASWVAGDGPEATRADAFAAACIAEAAVASAAALVEANLAVQASDDRAASARAHADASRAARRSLEATARGA